MKNTTNESKFAIMNRGSVMLKKIKQLSSTSFVSTSHFVSSDF